MKKLFYTPIIAVLMILTACATLGLPTADSFKERVAVSYATVEGVSRSTIILLNAKVISINDAKNVVAQANNALAGIAIAESMAKTDMTAADAKLNAIRTILVALQAYITTKEQK